jgi:hypothetical protein
VYVYHLLLTRGWLQHVSAYIGHLQVYYRNTKCLLKLQRIIVTPTQRIRCSLSNII